MIYFKKITVTEYTLAQLEAALRKVALKRTSSLDMVGSSTDAGTKMLFLGYEAKDGVTFTRVKYFIEKYLPKLIIKLSTDQHDCYYSIRFSFISTMMFVLFSIFALMTILGVVTNSTNIINILPIFFVIVAYFAMVLIEIKLTKAKVDKALKSYEEAKLK